MAANGLLVMAYGTPATLDDVETYYTHVRRGRPPTPEQVAELRGRYEAIGGTSPLLARTRAQADGIGRELGDGWRVELGMKHSAPFIEDGAAALDGTNAIGLVLAPHFSRGSVGEYAARAAGVDVIPNWHMEPTLIELLAERVTAAQLPGALTVFTAHSLPVRVLTDDDPYPAQVRETAEAVAIAAGIDDWQVAWQSAGKTADEWVGPDILEVMRDTKRDVVVCPCGFVCDHLEILYDLDVQAAQLAAELGTRFARTASLNDDPRFLRMLADLVRARAA